MSDTNFTPKDFYVYIHRKATTGEVFYVGKGQDRRAWFKGNRSSIWKRVVKKHGLTVEIAQDGLQEWYAHELECELIALHGRRDLGYGHLANFTDGGEGVAGRVLTGEQFANVVKANQRKAADPEWRAKTAAAIRKLHTNPEYRAKSSAAMRKMHEDPEFRAKHLEAMRKMHADPAHKAKITEAFCKAKATPEWRANNAEAARKRAANPEWQNQHAERMRKLHADPKFKQKNAEANFLRFADPCYREKIAEGNRKRASDPEWKAKNAEAVRKTTSSPEWRAKNAEAMRKLAARPEWRAKKAEIARKQAKPVTCLETGKTFDGLAYAVAWLKTAGWPKASTGRVSDAANSKRPSAYGYTWEYASKN
jgi:hypothetical protein